MKATLQSVNSNVAFFVSQRCNRESPPLHSISAYIYMDWSGGAYSELIFTSKLEQSDPYLCQR